MERHTFGVSPEQRFLGYQFHGTTTQGYSPGLSRQVNVSVGAPKVIVPWQTSEGYHVSLKELRGKL
jgi:hypothetical protein